MSPAHCCLQRFGYSLNCRLPSSLDAWAWLVALPFCSFRWAENASSLRSAFLHNPLQAFFCFWRSEKNFWKQTTRRREFSANWIRIAHAALYYFGEIYGYEKTQFFKVGIICEKMMRYPKGSNPLCSGSSNRGEQHPCWQGDSKGNSVLFCLGCPEGIVFPFDRKNPKKPAVSWHTIFMEKSSVLYLCSRLTPERGWLRHLLCRQIAAGRRFPAAVGQTDFVRTRTKYGFAHRAKSDWPRRE